MWSRSTLALWKSRSSRTPCRKSPHRRPTFRPCLEALEDRCVPAVWNVTSPVDNVNQPGTLHWAVAHVKNGDVIDIQTSQPIVLTHGELYLAHDVTIYFQAASF